ncbi:MAG: type II toxin-antitoxin system RelE/ParE family toxin [Lachnospiraceae bacterium]|nr:type II toxin-antitoxin system RelE/ParE family toxin [Lachnospiraceae bacterium]
MKYQIKYSPTVAEKLKKMRTQITSSHSKEIAIKVISAILESINELKNNPEIGPSVEAIMGIPTPYRFLHVEKNFVFYRLEDNTIYIIEIFNEREDFLWKMFHIKLRTWESMNFWGE